MLSPNCYNDDIALDVPNFQHRPNKHAAPCPTVAMLLAMTIRFTWLASPSAAIGALKVWALAEVVMAAVYFGEWQRLQFEDPEIAPPPSPLISGFELVYLVPLFAAVIVTWRWWRTTGPALDRRTSLGLAVYSLTSILSIALWDGATTLGQARPLYALDAGISLGGLWPALSLIAFIRQSVARP